jgi:AcrR family transcriptional regulator
MPRGGHTGTRGVPRAEREEQILDAAAIEFARGGYAALSVQDVADRAGISKPLIYEYFGSKESLYVACAQRAGRTLVDQVAGALEVPASAALDRGALALRAVFTALEPRPHDWVLLFDRSVPPGGPGESTARGYLEALAALAETGIADSFPLEVLPDPLDVAALTHVWLSIVTSLLEWWMLHPEQSAQQMIDRSARLLAALAENP